MLNFTAPKDTFVAVSNGKRTVTVFPEKPEVPKNDDLVLLSGPEKEPADRRISWPGEYDFGGLSIRGIGHEEGKRVSYVLEFPEARCAFLASPLHDWTDYELELLSAVDVLVLPATDAKIAQKLIDEIDPRILLPINTGDKEAYAETLKVCGAQDKEVESAYQLKGSLPAEGREVVVLG